MTVSQFSASLACSPHVTIIRVSGTRLPDGTPRRIPIRPREARQPDFDDKFDFDTLFYDVLWNIDKTRIRLIAPALLNLESMMEQSQVKAKPSNAACSMAIRNLDRASEIEIAVPAGTESITIAGPAGSFDLVPESTRFDLLSGRRVVFTLSKNNHLDWIKDWARYYRDVHGADAVLIYDNMSTAYTREELAAALKSVEGLKSIVIVEWPFRHGPPGVGLRGYWDSNFSQLGTFAHARWRLLQDARSVLNCDIDELVVSRSGKSVFAAAEQSVTGVVSFLGDWMFGINEVTPPARPGVLPKFTDYKHRLRSRWGLKFGIFPSRIERCKSKWAAVPARTPLLAQWHIHTINGWLPSRIRSLNLSFRHFREINFNWKYDRLNRENFDRSRHVPDPDLERSFARIDWNR